MFKIRLGGSNEFVSEIDSNWNRAIPRGKVEFVKGWNNPSALVFKTHNKAKAAANQVWDIEGFHTSIEEV